MSHNINITGNNNQAVAGDNNTVTVTITADQKQNFQNLSKQLLEEIQKSPLPEDEKKDVLDLAEGVQEEAEKETPALKNVNRHLTGITKAIGTAGVGVGSIIKVVNDIKAFVEQLSQ